MAKSDSKQRNVRLKMDAWFELADLADRWECKEATALERAIHEAHESGVDLAGIGTPIEGARPATRIEPISIPGISMGLSALAEPKAPTVVRRFRCLHHNGGELSVSRWGDICVDCREQGHNDEPRNCRECALNQGAL